MNIEITFASLLDQFKVILTVLILAAPLESTMAQDIRANNNVAVWQENPSGEDGQPHKIVQLVGYEPGNLEGVYTIDNKFDVRISFGFIANPGVDRVAPPDRWLSVLLASDPEIRRLSVQSPWPLSDADKIGLIENGFNLQYVSFIGIDNIDETYVLKMLTSCTAVREVSIHECNNFNSASSIISDIRNILLKRGGVLHL